MAGQLQYRRDIAANWTSANPTLLVGELGYETDTGKFKIGTGFVSWNNLSYLNVLSSANTFYYSNTFIYLTSGSPWTLPASVQKTGAVFKVVLVGGGGQGGGTPATAGHVGNGGGSGGVVIGTYTYAAGQTTLTFTIGAGGSGAGTNATGTAGGASTCTYNGVTFTANGGGGGLSSSSVNNGGAGGTASGGTLNIAGWKGDTGGVNTATMSYVGKGADTPLGWGAGGVGRSTAGTGNAASNYGAGGQGGQNAATATARSGGVGTGGIIQIIY
jgi:hypothetical protein